MPRTYTPRLRHVRASSRNCPVFAGHRRFAHDLATGQTCCCTCTDADDDASPPETSRASAELRLLILANTRLRPPKLRFARLVLPSATLPETRRSARDRAGVAPRLFARSTSDTCGQGRPSSQKAKPSCGREGARLAVAPREAGFCQVRVESAGDELLRRWEERAVGGGVASTY